MAELSPLAAGLTPRELSDLVRAHFGNTPFAFGVLPGGARCACGLLSRGRLASPPDPARAIRHTLYTLWRTLIDVHARRAEFPDPDGFARAKERALSLLARLSRSL